MPVIDHNSEPAYHWYKMVKDYAGKGASNRLPSRLAQNPIEYDQADQQLHHLARTVMLVTATNPTLATCDHPTPSGASIKVVYYHDHKVVTNTCSYCGGTHQWERSSTIPWSNS